MTQLSKLVGWVLKWYYQRLAAKLYRIADGLSFILVMGGLCGFISALIVHDFFAHEFGWNFHSIRPMSLESAATAFFAIACVGAIVLGVFLVAIAGGWTDDFLRQTDPE